jgi:hypothetical protein
MGTPHGPKIVLQNRIMPIAGAGDGAGKPEEGPDGITGFRRQEALLKTGALQDAILNSAYFSSIATDEKSVNQISNAGAERMFGFAALDVVNQVTPADLSDPQELIARYKPEPGVAHADYVGFWGADIQGKVVAMTASSSSTRIRRTVRASAAAGVSWRVVSPTQCLLLQSGVSI